MRLIDAAEYVSTKPLEELNITKQHQADDLIKRQDAIRAISQQARYANGDMAYIDAISQLPSGQKTGKWIFVHPIQEDDSGGFLCSCCKYGEYKQSNYCPNCGARMEMVK